MEHAADDDGDGCDRRGVLLAGGDEAGRARGVRGGAHCNAAADALAVAPVHRVAHLIQQDLAEAASEQAAREVEQEHQWDRRADDIADEHGEAAGRAALAEHQVVELRQAEEPAHGHRAEKAPGTRGDRPLHETRFCLTHLPTQKLRWAAFCIFNQLRSLRYHGHSAVRISHIFTAKFIYGFHDPGRFIEGCTELPGN